MDRARKWLWILLILLGLLRLASLGAYPLADMTEARYGNIARLMAKTGDWITPQYTQGVPFWGKPPLSTWLAAGSMKLFGINEFAARLPSFLMAVAAMALVWQLGALQRSRDHALVAAMVLATSAVFFVGSGAVMTDPALLVGTTLSMSAFWQAINPNGGAGKPWGYVFFLGLAIGLLAKGPVAVVLTALPIGAWVLLQRRWLHAWQRLPWVGGLVLTALLSAPWYLLAERKTPGFLDYFLVGEHWKRFTVPGWKGDLYGKAHSMPRGSIWLFGLLATLPWSLILPGWLLRKKCRTRLLERNTGGDGWVLYLLLWALAPMVLFTPAGNILWTYMLPGLPALALLAAELMIAGSASTQKPIAAFKSMGWVAGTVLLLGGITLSWMTLSHGFTDWSQKRLFMTYRESRAGSDAPLIYLFERPYSAEFYSGGEARLAHNLKEARVFSRNHAAAFLAVKIHDLDHHLPASFKKRFTIVYRDSHYCLGVLNKPLQGISAHGL